MKKNPLQRLSEMGQSVWLDYLSRSLITSGKLKALIAEDALRGMTSNPSIFEKSIDGSNDYDGEIRAMAQAGRSVPEIYQALTVRDVQMAADVFRPVYDRLNGADGYVSLEVNPHLARDTEGTVKEARRLIWAAVGRPNIFIKIPATRERAPGDHSVPERGDQHQCDAPLRPAALPRGGQGPSQRNRETHSARRERPTRWHRWPASFSAASTSSWTRYLKESR